MDLIQKAKNLGCIIKNDEYYLWEIQKWLREVCNISVEVTSLFWEKGEKEFEWNVYLEGSEGFGSFPNFKTYEEALGVGLYQALLLL